MKKRAVLIRSLSPSTTLVSTRLFYRSGNPLARSTERHRIVPNLYKYSLHGRNLGLFSSVFLPSLQTRSPFCALSSRALSTSSPHSAQEVLVGDDDVAKKLGFEKMSEDFIDECKSKAVLYKHMKTGAEIMSLSNDDENKVFGIAFWTLPKDSTGIPSILERSVFCGSRKYSLKEPVVELWKKGTLRTLCYVNRDVDRTCYTAASTNTKDFYNTVDVYLDAIFFPKCVDDVKTFQQQGWHYELNDPSGDITYNGAVFNKMKGIYSEPDSLFRRATQKALFPDNNYAFDDGGDPQDILSLSFEEFKEFHRKFYHPSNARIWFYGDDNPNERLCILSEYLDMFEANLACEESRVDPQKLFLEPVRIIQKYPAAKGVDLKKNHMVCLTWLLSETRLDFETKLALGFLDHLMMGTHASPFIGDTIVPREIKELFQDQFSVGLKGVSEDAIQQMEDLIMNTLNRVAELGFDPDAVEEVMNKIELSMRENNTRSRSFPHGVELMLHSMGNWIYDLDPFEPLKYEEPLRAVKARVAKEGSTAVFSPLIKKLILQNPHRVIIHMQPDPEKASRDEAAEKENLEKVKASMTQEDLDELASATHELRLKQETPDPPEALKCLPSLFLQDIPKKPIQVPIEVGDINGTKVLHHDLFTNNVLYVEVLFNMCSLKQELLPLVPLFWESLLAMGTKELNSVQLNQLIERKTGGILIQPLTSGVRGKQDPCSHLIIQGKAMSERAEDLFNLVNCVLQDVQLTDQRCFKRIVSERKTKMENKLRNKGDNTAITERRMDAKLYVAGWVIEQMFGASNLDYLRAIEKKIDEDWSEVSSSLEEIRRTLFTKNGCLVNLTADWRTLKNSEKHVSNFLDMLPNTSPVLKNAWSAPLPRMNEAILSPTLASSVGKAANLYETGYECNGSAVVISKFLTNTLNGRCDFNPNSGIFSYLSHGHPNLLRTIDGYDRICYFLRELKMDNDTLNKAIIEAIGETYYYQFPQEKGFASLCRYLLEINEEERLVTREEFLSTSLNDFKAFANVIEATKKKAVVVAVATPNEVNSANALRPGLFEVKKLYNLKC